jgi:hypothetical protein
MHDGTFAVVHMNRLKRAYGSADKDSVEPFDSNARKQMDSLYFNEVTPRRMSINRRK